MPSYSPAASDCDRFHESTHSVLPGSKLGSAVTPEMEHPLENRVDVSLPDGIPDK